MRAPDLTQEEADGTGLGPVLTPKALLDFVRHKGNIFLALSGDSATPSSISSLLLEFDVTLPPDKLSHTVDHFDYDTYTANEKHDVLILPQPAPVRPDIKDFFGGDGVVAFPRAVAQTLGNSNPLLNPILKAKASSYAYSPKEEEAGSEDPFATGEQASLVTAVQARNSARFTVFGSLEALQNSWFDATVKTLAGPKVKTTNRDFARRVTEWTFKEVGVLKVGAVRHQLSSSLEKPENQSVSDVANPTNYRVKNEVVCATACMNLKSTKRARHSTSNCQNTSRHTTRRLYWPKATKFNSSSRCCRLSID